MSVFLSVGPDRVTRFSGGTALPYFALLPLKPSSRPTPNTPNTVLPASCGLLLLLTVTSSCLPAPPVLCKPLILRPVCDVVVVMHLAALREIPIPAYSAHSLPA